MRIEDGQPEQHETPLAVNAAATPGVAGPTPAFSTGNAQGAVRDLSGERLSLLAASEAECAAAQSYGMAADAGRRTGYAASMAPLGGSAGDQMALPVVPDNALPAAQSYGYPYGGMEPTAAAAGWDYDAGLPG
jgi:hypothetical protein